MKTAVKIGTMQWVIIGLAVATAVVHLFLPGEIMKLNALGYLGLLAAYFLVLPGLKIKRDWIRWAFIAYAAITILAYFISWGIADGLTQPLGMVTKLIEAALIVLLLRDR